MVIALRARADLVHPELADMGTHGGAEATSSSMPVAPPTMSVMQAAVYSLCTEESQPKVLLAVPNDDAHLRDGYEGEHVMSRDEP